MSVYTACYEGFASFVSFGWIFDEVDNSLAYGDGFVAGVAVAVALWLAVWLVKRLLRGGTKRRGITIPGERGDLFIALPAMYEFVKRILGDFSETELQTVRLHEHRKHIQMAVVVGVTPGTNLIPLRDSLQTRIIADAAESLGLQSPMRVDIQIRSMEADEAKIAKRNRKAGITPPPGPDVAFDADGDI